MYLQVVRHFWERNDIKGAINATGKFPDHSVGIYWKSLSVLLHLFLGIRTISKQCNSVCSLSSKESFDPVAGASRCDQCSHGEKGYTQLRFVFLFASWACGLT